MRTRWCSMPAHHLLPNRNTQPPTPGSGEWHVWIGTFRPASRGQRSTRRLRWRSDNLRPSPAPKTSAAPTATGRARPRAAGGRPPVGGPPRPGCPRPDAPGSGRRTPTHAAARLRSPGRRTVDCDTSQRISNGGSGEPIGSAMTTGRVSQAPKLGGAAAVPGDRVADRKSVV